VSGEPFTVHERSGWRVIVAGIILLIVAEGIAMHLLLAKWSAVAAWSWTVLDVWAIVWLIGDAHALRLRRSFVDDETLHIRFGLRWSVDVPLASIVSIEAVRSERDWKRKDVLKVAILDEPRWLITLEEPLIAHGLAGLRKEIRAIALQPDQDAFISRLTANVRSCCDARAARR
jgi:hypothetical protein